LTVEMVGRASALVGGVPAGPPEIGRRSEKRQRGGEELGKEDGGREG